MAVAPVNDIVAVTASQQGVVPRPAVDDVVAGSSEEPPVVSRAAVDDVVGRSSEEKVSFAMAAYLVVALLTVQVVRLVGAGERAALGAAW